MILSAQTIRRRGIVSPFCERTVFEGVSYGLSSHGYDVRIAESLELRPGDFVLASTIERFDMPPDVAATVNDKSTWVRKGLCVQTTVIEAGWRGHLTLELTLHGPGKLFVPAGVSALRKSCSTNSTSRLSSPIPRRANTRISKPGRGPRFSRSRHETDRPHHLAARGGLLRCAIAVRLPGDGRGTPPTAARRRAFREHDRRVGDERAHAARERGMTRFIDLSGQDIAGWRVIERAENSRTGMACWWCRCRACGVMQRVHGGNLRAGTSRQCMRCRGRMQRRQSHPIGSAPE